MKNTTILPNEMQVEQQLARGLTFNGQPYPPIHWGEVPSAEGLYSTCADMLRYVNAYLMADTQHICTMINRPIAATNVKNVHTAGGWFLFRRNKNSPTVLTHSGCNGGYACYIAFEPRRKVGIVLMANIDQNLDNLGIMLLDFLLR